MELFVLQKILLTAMYSVFAVVRAKRLYIYKSKNRSGIAAVAAITFMPNVLDCVSSVFFPDENSAAFIAFLLAEISVYLLTPFVLYAFVRDWLSTSAYIYINQLVFMSLPATFLFYILFGAALPSTNNVSLQTIVVQCAAQALFQWLSIKACEKHWLGKIPPAITIPVYIIVFYSFKLSDDIYKYTHRIPETYITPSNRDESGVYITIIIILLFVITFISCSIVVYRRNTSIQRRKAMLNRQVSIFLKNSTENIRVFRHDLANHLQISQSSEVLDIEEYRRSLTELAENFISPTVTGDRRTDIFLAQACGFVSVSNVQYDTGELLSAVSAEDRAQAKNEILERVAALLVKEDMKEDISITN